MVKFRNVALVIGINDYADLRVADLTTARFDAKKLANVLDKNYEYEVELLTDENQLATFAGIEQALERLADRVKPRDAAEKVRLVFYFAGHGVPSQGEDGEAGALVAQDAELEQRKNFLPMKDLHDSLTELDCHHVLIILDCCFAGAFKFNTRHLGFEYTPEEITKERYQRYEGSAAWQVIASAAYDQKALDITLDNRGAKRSGNDPQTATWQEDSEPNSPFAAALFRTLDKTLDQNNTHTPADYTKDGITTATELFVFLDNEVYEGIKKTNHQQVPQFWSLQKKHDKGEFFFETGEFDLAKLPDTPELSQENNPYRGLESFDEAQQRFFFGRQELVKELQGYVERNGHPFTVVLGVSGSGKSSLVKAGLVPQLRELQANWQILTPMRPGLAPLKALAKVMLALDKEVYPNEFQQLEGLTAKLKDARKRSPHDKALTQLLTAWRRNDPDGKLWLIVRNFELWQQLSDDDRPMLEQLRQVGLCRSGLVLEHLEELKAQSNDGERHALESFYQRCMTQIEDWSEDWQNNPEHLGKLIGQWGEKYPAHKLLLVIDQFEELITLASEDERESFLVALCAILQASPQQLRVVATLRADFEARFLNAEHLKDFWQLENRFLVRPMRRDEFRQVIEGPAQDYVLAFGVNDRNYSLVDQLIDEVELMPGGLPLLSFTLSELYREYVRSDRTDRILSWDDYKKLHGVSGALTGRATAEYQSLDEQHQATMQRVMLRMVTIEGGGVTRRRVPKSELVYPSDEENERVELVINLLVNARLLVKGQETRESYVEPAHDFLVRGWDKLQEWIKENQEDIALQQRLTFSVNDWVTGKGGLWVREVERLTRLETVLGSRQNNWLNQLEIEFFQKSSQQRFDELKESERQRDEAINGQADALVSLSEMRFTTHDQLGALLASTKAVHQLRNRYGAQAAAKNSAVLALLQSICNIREFNRLESHTETIRVVTFSPTENILVTASDDQLIKVWDYNGQEYRTINAHDYGDISLCFSPDGKIIASTSSHRIKLWNLQTGELITEFYIRGEPTFNSVCFSPNGKWLAAGTIRNTIAVWQISIGDSGILSDDLSILVHSESTDEQWGGIKSICFSPDSTMLASASSSARDVKLWSLAEKSLLKMFSNDRERRSYMSLNFSPDGQILAYADSSSEHIKLWCVEDGTLLKTLEHGRGTIAVCFSHDGKTVASGDIDGVVRIWEVDGALMQLLQAHNRGITCLSFSHDDQIIASASFDRSVKLWKILGTYQILKTIQSDKSSTIATSSDGQIIAIVTIRNTIEICRADGTLIQTLEAPNDEKVVKIKFSINDQIIALVTQNNSIYLTNLDVNLKDWYILTKQNDEITDFIFSSTSRYIAFATSNNDIYIWDFSSQKIIRELRGVHQHFADCLEFDCNDQTLLSKGWNDNSAKLWDINDGSFIIIEHGNKEGNPVHLACFSPDSQVIATAHLTIDNSSSNAVNVVKLWSKEGKHINTLVHNNNKFERVNQVVFNSDNILIISASRETIKLWTIEGKLLKELIVDNSPINRVSFCSNINAIIGISVDNVITIWTMDGELIKSIVSEKQESRNGGWNDLGNITISRNGQTIVGTKKPNSQNFDSIVVWSFELNNLLVIAYKWLNSYLQSHSSLELERKLYQEYQRGLQIEEEE